MNSNVILFAIFFHVCWVVFLYAVLTVLRAPTAWGVDTKSRLLGRYAVYEPKVSANLSNQFEWPMLFYTCCLLIIHSNSADAFQCFLAWVFVAGRVIHSFVQIFTNNIRLRGAVFTINFVAVLIMWIRLVLIVV